MKKTILIISIFAVVNIFAAVCPVWNETTVYNQGDDVCYHDQEYEVAQNVYNISGYDYRPDGPFAHFWQSTDDCDCEEQPQQDCWEFDGGDITNTNNDGNVYIGDKNSGNYIEFSVNPNEGGKLASRDIFGGRVDFSTLGFCLGSDFGGNSIDYVKFNHEGLHVNKIQGVSATNMPITIESDVALESDYKLTAGKLQVNGDAKIYGELFARQVTVTLDAFPDYVFSPSYQLKSLSEIEKYIKKHGTLPNMPSEAEVKEHGVNLGEMNAKLLEKIEEMTLHMIQMQKRIEELEAGLKK